MFVDMDVEHDAMHFGGTVTEPTFDGCFWRIDGRRSCVAALTGAVVPTP